MCPLSPQDQHVCQSHHGIAEAVTGILGSTQFPSGSFYHPRSTSSRFRSTRKAVVCPGNFSDSNGISDDGKRQKRSYSVPIQLNQCPHALSEQIDKKAVTILDNMMQYYAIRYGTISQKLERHV